MIVRSVDQNGDWNFGKGKNDYRVNRDAVEQTIATRLKSFLGDCFFALDAGVDWFNLLGAKDELALQLAVSAIILNTQDVLKINSLLINKTNDRKITLTYSVNTVYGEVQNTEVFFKAGDVLTTEEGDPLTTEDGDILITG